MRQAKGAGVTVSSSRAPCRSVSGTRLIGRSRGLAAYFQFRAVTGGITMSREAPGDILSHL